MLSQLRLCKDGLRGYCEKGYLSRTLLYRLFKNKEEIYQAVFADWLLSREAAAKLTAEEPGSSYDRLMKVCRLMTLEPWAEMVGTPMGSEFLQTCVLVDAENDALYRKIVHQCSATILGDQASAEVFLLALDGLFVDQPSIDVLEQRTKLLAMRFAPSAAKKASTL